MASAMLGELSAVLVTGGLLLAASISTGHGNELPVSAIPTEAEAAFNQAMKDSSKFSFDSLPLAPPTSAEVYEPLVHALARIGVRSEYSSRLGGLNMDLTHLLLPQLSFAAERVLFADLVKEGVILRPGEACDLPLPGHFLIASPAVVDEGVTKKLIERLQKVIAHRSPHSAAARAQVVTTAMTTTATTASTVDAPATGGKRKEVEADEVQEGKEVKEAKDTKRSKK